jgi:hypothetical protein
MARKSIRVGIMPLRDIKARTIAIARGKYKPAPEEPRIGLLAAAPHWRRNQLQNNILTNCLRR